MRWSLTSLPLLLWALQNVGGAENSGVDFFEKEIRPILVSECYQCHSAEEKIKGKLRLDWKGGWQKGGESGAAIIPGSVGKSLVIQAVRQTDPDLQMPPNKKLRVDQIQALEKWVAMGSPDPRISAESSNEQKQLNIEAAKQYWAFRSVKDTPLPEVSDKKWPHTSIDHFILAAQEKKGIHPVPDSDSVTLLRRIYFDLIGLPPPPEKVETFSKVATSGRQKAIESLVDELLASQEFGVRWARHWLDVARFSQSTGGGRTLLFGEAWRYRDYVVDSFNSDKPYDQFIREQIAGDLLQDGSMEENRAALIATAFLLLGPTNYELQDKTVLEMDIVDEQLDTMGKAFLGLTIGCARCHDHKFDPIRTEDYYGMAGIFKSTKSVIHSNVSTWNKRPLPMSPEQQKLSSAQTVRIATLKKEINQLKKTTNSKKPAVSPIQISRLSGIVVDDLQATLKGAWTQSTSHKGYVGTNYIHDDAKDKGTKEVAYKVKIPEDGKFEVRLSYTEGTNRSSKVPVLIRHADGEVTKYINQTKKPPLDGHFISLGTFDFLVGEWEAVVISTQGTTQHVIADAVQFLPEGTTSSTKKEVKNADDFGGIIVDNPDAKASGPWVKSDSVKNHLGSEYLYTGDPSSKVVYPVNFAQGGKYEVRISYTHHPNRSTKTLVTVRHNDGEKTFRINQRNEPAADGYFQSLGFFEFQSGQWDAVEISAMDSDGTVVADAVQFLPEGAPVVAQKKPKPEDEIDQSGLASDKERLANIQKELKELESKAVKQPNIIAAEEAKEPGDIKIAIRGNVHNAGTKTPRRFIQVLNEGPLPKISPNSSGRAELAEWIAGTNNPLTARVFVNRVWHHLFGTGIVSSVDNFGHMGQMPTNPELIDHLATGFMANGWSIKKLIRDIMLSRVYQLSSEPENLQKKADLENLLHWRQNRRRLQAEAIRDSILSVSGSLDKTIGGPTVKPGTKTEYGYNFEGSRRSIYIPVFRNTVPEIMQVFDFADPNLVMGQRTTSSVPTQALFLMNNPFVQQQSKTAASRLLQDEPGNNQVKVNYAYKLTLGRLPSIRETKAVLDFLESSEKPEIAWSAVFHSLFASLNFRYLD